MKHTFKLLAISLLSVMMLTMLVFPMAAVGQTYKMRETDELPIEWAGLLRAPDEGLIFTFGVNFQVTEAGYLTEVHRVFTEIEQGDFNVTVYEDENPIYTGVWTVAEAAGELKWSTFTLEEPVRMETGKAYCVAVETNASTEEYLVIEGWFPVNSDKFVTDAGSGRFGVGEGRVYPQNQGASGRTFLVDVTFLPDSETTPPAEDNNDTEAPETGSAVLAVMGVAVASLGVIAVVSKKRAA